MSLLDVEDIRVHTDVTELEGASGLRLKHKGKAK
jgi:hypothetical protein